LFVNQCRKTRRMNESNHSVMADLRALPRAAWFIFAGTFINRCGTLVMPFITLYMTRHGFTIHQAGTALLAYGVGNLLASFIGGQLADSCGRKHTMMLSFFSTAGVMMAFPHAESLTAIYALMALAGLTGEIYRPAVNALIADLIPEQERLTAYAANRTALNAGWAFGPAIGGFITIYNWDWLFYADGITTAIFGVIAWQALPPGNRTPKAERSNQKVYGQIFCNGPFMLFWSACFLLAIPFMQLNAAFSLHVTDAGYPDWVYGLVNSLNGVLIVLIELPLTSITRRYRPRFVIALGFFLMGIGIMYTAWADSIPKFCFMMTVFTLGEIISLPIVMTHLSRIIPEHARGRYMGVFGMNWAFAVLVGPKLGLHMYSIDPFTWWIIAGICGMAGGLLVLKQPDHYNPEQEPSK
jgi:MFS family permease